MGKRKVATTQQIEDKNCRRITYLKRKKGLLRKAMELAMLCKMKISIGIFDEEKNHLVVYNSNADFDFETGLDVQKKASIEFY